ncbi:penicillin-binding protein activator [Sphingopyxis granuli]|uniref:penicillin-binding protein activator n=2 Tax=Sphingomonadaceae TaxID=41297 RepID=UPI00086EF416|nr:penicillin-binding protein activator [Sphingopyxis granuli]APW74195.1 penicillin-binding protein activator [Sphingopyxis granuli]AVA15807.1 penicillin-binding protein activator [Sphingopyxis sp. MG]ODU30291.1 MAG: ABC transporter substrate-binding protein [Sphingopyxis sp. SCN 67-31]QUM74313.1 penicillin-binding protein activator [Sphingopyxis granuli]
MAESVVKRQDNALRRRRLLRGMATLALGGLLAACQVVPKSGGPAAPPPPENPDETVGPGLPTDTDRHRVALLVPQTGANADVGTAIANATTLALLDTRADKVRITTYDTALGAAAAARQAVADGNRLILGPLLSEDVAAVAPIARAAKVPVLSFSNDSGVAGNGVFILGFVPGQSVERVVAFARGKGHQRFGALVPKNVYGDRAAAAFRDAVREAGGTLVAVETYDRTATALTGAARRLANGGAMDAVLIADVGGNAIRAVPIVKGAGSKQILGTELWNTDASLGSNAAMRGAWFASVSDGLYGQLATKYRARYGKAPYRLASLGYDSVLLTVRIARDWKPGTAFPVNRLLAADGFGGIDGIFRFNNRGIAVRALEVSEVGAGGFRVVDPAPAKW